MDSLLSLASSPKFIAANILCVLLLPFLAGMLFGNPRNIKMAPTNREAGVEIVLVFFPFALYSLAHIINGSFFEIVAGPELPMASLIVSCMAVLSLIKAAAKAKGKIDSSKMMVLGVCFLFLFMMCVGLVFHLTLASNKSEWFMVVNSSLVVLASGYSFAVSAALAYASEHPNELGGTS